MQKTLLVDRSGMPQAWISPRKALKFYVKNDVLWELGTPVARFESFPSKATGQTSVIQPASIIGVRGDAHGFLKNGALCSNRVSRKMLFARDRWICVYCGIQYPESLLTKEHILPQSRNGQNTWTNLVTACKTCNTKKSNKTPEEAGMNLLYVPYTPSKWEGLILSNRTILADQMDFLMTRVPKTSRLWLNPHNSKA